MSAVYSLNTLDGQPLVSESTSTFLLKTYDLILDIFLFFHNNNNNQAFYSQASWDRLEMKPHEPKKQVQNKSEKEGENKVR
jgi:hypothetical protein